MYKGTYKKLYKIWMHNYLGILMQKFYSLYRKKKEIFLQIIVDFDVEIIDFLKKNFQPV